MTWIALKAPFNPNQAVKKTVPNMPNEGHWPSWNNSRREDWLKVSACVLWCLQEKCHQYWPEERSARYQYFVVDPLAQYNMPLYVLREFKVTDARVSLLLLCRSLRARSDILSSKRARSPRESEGLCDLLRPTTVRSRSTFSNRMAGWSVQCRRNVENGTVAWTFGQFCVSALILLTDEVKSTWRLNTSQSNIVFHNTWRKGLNKATS